MEHIKNLCPDESDTIYRYLGGDAQNGILSCGYMAKSARKSQSQFSIPYYSCFILLEGTGEYLDENGNRVRLVPGSVVQRLPDVIHTTRVDEGSGWLEFYVSFGRSFYQALQSVGLLGGAPTSENGRSRACLRISEYDALLKRMKQAADGELYPVLADAQAMALSFFAGTDNEKESGQAWVKEACRILDKYYLEKEAARLTAAELSMGYENFRKQFSRRFGISPGAYCLERKMRTAEMMLLSGQSVKQVAGNLGYSDAYIFSKQFKKYANETPSRFGGHTF